MKYLNMYEQHINDPQTGDYVIDVNDGFAKIVKPFLNNDEQFYRIKYFTDGGFIIPVPRLHIKHFGTSDEMEEILQIKTQTNKYNL